MRGVELAREPDIRSPCEVAFAVLDEAVNRGVVSVDSGVEGAQSDRGKCAGPVKPIGLSSDMGMERTLFD